MSSHQNASRCSSSPMAMIFAPRQSTARNKAPRSPPASNRGVRPSEIETPTMKRKNGKIRSVGVQPCHSECSSGAYTWPQSPGSLTSSIAATVMPRRASTEAKRNGAVLLIRCFSG